MLPLVFYVKTNEGHYYIQAPYEGVLGFALYSDDQCWPGGLGIGTWEFVPDEEVPPAVRENLDPVLEFLKESWERF